MGRIGIIANPASGKDIRRLVAHGSVFDNNEKVNIVKRMLSIFDEVGIKEVLFMPDYFQIGLKALKALGKMRLKVEIIDMSVEFTQDDSTKAAHILERERVDCLITLGGDGTNRVVAKGLSHDSELPLLPISTGTNNVFPYMIEGTVAALAAAAIAKGVVSKEEGCFRAKRVELFKEGELRDIALIDLVSLDCSFIGSRAIWHPEEMKEIFSTIAKPDSIGASSIGGYLIPTSEIDDRGVYVRLGKEGRRLFAPLVPGVVKEVYVECFSEVAFLKKYPISINKGVIALDGEREIEFSDGKWEVQVTRRGPLVVDIKKVLILASERGFLKR
ncbi:MAG: NAD(+)/NADH kinase [Synergistetes bacterium]|nr:NAD(+)/NADH kinase [Synergistota bacterium]MCX8127740.1 NAD(+)/NADH kinase [Synergistota bacterium]MDW8191345.1 NAD(+)/NADH kinase [Synergistota bacterium]